MDTILLQIFSDLLDLPIQVEIVSVPHRSGHLPLDTPQVEGLPAGLVAQGLVQLEGGLVQQLEDGELGGQLQAVRLHPCAHSDHT